jgi:hypothetical protein
VAATFGINFRTQILWDGSKQPNILQMMARAHSLAARRLAQGAFTETHKVGRGVRSEVDGVCGQAGDNRS